MKNDAINARWLGRGIHPQILQITCVVYSLGLFSRVPTYLRAWVPENIMRSFRFWSGFWSNLYSDPRIAARDSCLLHHRIPSPHARKNRWYPSNVSESLAQVKLGKAAHSRKYWNSITCGHLSHITCSVSICTLLFWGRHGLTDSTHLRFLQLPSVHEVFGCSYRKKTNLSITATSWISLLNWNGRYFYLRSLQAR